MWMIIAFLIILLLAIAVAWFKDVHVKKVSKLNCKVYKQMNKEFKKFSHNLKNDCSLWPF